MRVETIGDATLYHGDCREILPTLPKVEAVITDPPYGINFKYDVGEDSETNFITSIRELNDAIGLTQLALLQYPEEMMRLVVPVLGAPDECLIWCYNSNTARQSRIWGFWRCKPDFSNVKQPAKNPTDARVNPMVAHYDWLSDIQQIKNVSAEKTGHPCQIPVKMVERVIQFMEAQTILDPFMGSGTTGVACVNLQRKFIGIEISEKYFNMACKRIETAYQQVPLFGEIK